MHDVRQINLTKFYTHTTGWANVEKLVDFIHNSEEILVPTFCQSDWLQFLPTSSGWWDLRPHVSREKPEVVTSIDCDVILF